VLTKYLNIETGHNRNRLTSNLEACMGDKGGKKDKHKSGKQKKNKDAQKEKKKQDKLPKKTP